MPAPQGWLVDPAVYAEKRPLHGRSEIEKFVPHRFEFALLDGVFEANGEARTGVGFYDAKVDSFWARGHIPGRPLMPGVLMIEATAQLCTFVFQREINKEKTRFMGFGGMDEARFRGSVTPPARFLMAVRADKMSARASQWSVQGFAENKLVFEGKIFAVAV